MLFQCCHPLQHIGTELKILTFGQRICRVCWATLETSSYSMCFMIYQHRSEREHHRVILAVYCSARALVKKTQEPGIKLQKADFFRNDTWTSPQTNSEDAPKIPFVHFFNSRWPPPCNAIFEKQGYTLILHLCSLEKNIFVSLLMF